MQPCNLRWLCWHFKRQNKNQRQICTHTLRVRFVCAEFIVCTVYAEHFQLVSEWSTTICFTKKNYMHKSANMFYGCRYLHTSFNKVNNWIRNVQTVWPCPFNRPKLIWKWFFVLQPNEKLKLQHALLLPLLLLYVYNNLWTFSVQHNKSRRLQSSLLVDVGSGNTE